MIVKIKENIMMIQVSKEKFQDVINSVNYRVEILEHEWTRYMCTEGCLKYNCFAIHKKGRFYIHKRLIES